MVKSVSSNLVGNLKWLKAINNSKSEPNLSFSHHWRVVPHIPSQAPPPFTMPLRTGAALPIQANKQAHCFLPHEATAPESTLALGLVRVPAAERAASLYRGGFRPVIGEPCLPGQEGAASQPLRCPSFTPESQVNSVLVLTKA